MKTLQLDYNQRMQVRAAARHQNGLFWANPGQTLQDDVIQLVAPSIFGNDRASSTSQKYELFPTSDILPGLRESGFEVVAAGQTASKEENRLVTRHCLRLAHRDDLAMNKHQTLGELRPELVLMNSHDGKSSFRFNLGIFRLVCLNGMVSGTSMRSMRTVHIHNSPELVIENAIQMAQGVDEMMEQVYQMQATKLTHSDYQQWEEEAGRLRVSDTTRRFRGLGGTRRLDDSRELNVWTGFNVLQENLMKGNFYVESATRQNRFLRAREIRSLQVGQKLNQELWDSAVQRIALPA